MSDWRKFGNRLVGASSQLKAALGIRDGMTPSEAVKLVVSAVPDLGKDVDMTGLDEDIELWGNLRSDQAAQPALDQATVLPDIASRAAIIASRPGIELVSAPSRRMGLLGPEETPGDVMRTSMGGRGGSFVGGLTDALIDPVNAVAAVGTGGGSVAAKELMQKVGAIAVAKQGIDVGRVGYDKGLGSDEFKDALAGAAGGLAAGIGVPVLAGAARNRLTAPRTPRAAVSKPVGANTLAEPVAKAPQEAPRSTFEDLLGGDPLARADDWIDRAAVRVKAIEAAVAQGATPEAVQHLDEARTNLQDAIANRESLSSHASAVADDLSDLDVEPGTIQAARWKSTGAPETPPPPTQADVAPTETPVDFGGPETWSIEAPSTPGPLDVYESARKSGSNPMVAAAKAAAKLPKAAGDMFRTGFRTVRSELIKNNMPATAEALSRAGFHQDDWSTRVRAKFDEIRAMGITDEDIARIQQQAQGGKLEGKDARAYQILRDVFDSQYGRAAEKDPSRGDPDLETIAGVAPPEGPYWPYKGDVVEPPSTIARNEKLRPLTSTGESKAPSLYKQRQENANSIPITSLAELEDVAMNRARSVGSLQGLASKERTPEAYPGIFKALLAEESNRNTDPADAHDAAVARLSEIQLPDIFEAAARDRPAATWDDLVKDKLVAGAADEVIKGRTMMTPQAQAAAGAVKAVTRTAQLGLAAPLNAMGLSYVPGIAYDAARSAGSGRVGAAAVAAKTGLKAVGNFGKNIVEDVAMQAGRAVGATDKLSASQKAFGRSRAGVNLPMRAIAVSDRDARLAVAQSLRELIPTMKHEQFRYTDRSLPMTDPRNIRIAQMEIANATQGFGTLADKLKHTGQDLPDIMRELTSQYMSPEIRQAEGMIPRLSTGGKIAAVGAAALIGEGVQDARAVMRGSGLNPPGSEETEDQKRSTMKSVVGTDRDPNLMVRVAQNVAGGAPFMKQAIQAGEYGDVPVPLLGAAPAVALAKQTYQAFKLAKETGDPRALLSLINAPGFGREWAKVVKYEQAREKNPGSGLGGVTQNQQWPWKIQALLDGDATLSEILGDTFGISEGLPLEQEARDHRAKRNEISDRRKEKQ